MSARACLPLLLSLFLPISLTMAQQGKLEFDKNSHDFGNIQEEEGPKEVTFTFTNKGNAPITLTYVKASCGCTTPSWTKEAVAPGETGFVKASYNPKGRPGSFRKGITIRTDGEPQAMVLRISGVVIPKPKGLKDYYPHSIGNLRFKVGYISFGDVMHDSSKTFVTGIYNDGIKPISLNLENSRIPSYMSASIDKPTISPKDSATLTLDFSGLERKDWGFVYGGIFLNTNDTDKAEKRLGFSANIKENFNKLPAGTKHPKVVFEEYKHDFGKVDQHGKVSHKFQLKNVGDGELLIRKTKTSCGCTVASPPVDTLQPGDSTFIEVFFSSGSRKGTQKKSITVITNDPNQDESVLWISAEVVPKSE